MTMRNMNMNKVMVTMMHMIHAFTILYHMTSHTIHHTYHINMIKIRHLCDSDAVNTIWHLKIFKIFEHDDEDSQVIFLMGLSHIILKGPHIRRTAPYYQPHISERHIRGTYQSTAPQIRGTAP